MFLYRKKLHGKGLKLIDLSKMIDYIVHLDELSISGTSYNHLLSRIQLVCPEQTQIIKNVSTVSLNKSAYV